MFRKMMALTLVFTFLFSTIVSVQAAAESTVLGKLTVVESTVLGKLTAVENTLYGSAQTGALLDRLSKVETDFYGAQTSSAMVDRINRLYGTVLEHTNGTASALTRVNMAEWAITHAVTADPVKKRLENLETMIDGSPKTGAISERIGMLASLAFAEGTMMPVNKTVAADTLVKIRLITPIDSKTVSVGDRVVYQVAEDVIVEGALVLAKGAAGWGTITKVSRSQNFGRDAEVEVDFSHATAIDGSVIDTCLGEKAKKEMETLAIAAGATVAGMALLGPVGIVAGAFVKGKNINIPEGTEMYIQTKSEALVHGIQTELL